MGLVDSVTSWLAAHQVPEKARSAAPFTVSYEYPDLQTQISAFRHRGGRGFRVPSISDALGVPAIQRCVTLISNTTGQLTVQGFLDGAPMAEVPRLIARPDPYRTPRDFYGPSGYNMATRGEVVWYVASFDGDGRPSSLVVVPLRELKVEKTSDRLRPRYEWGTIVSTRWTPVNTSGRFVHVMYLEEPGDLRGRGPLQMAGAAVTVSVEAQEWAANFYRQGGKPPIVLHSETDLEDDEAGALKEAWSATPNNMPQVTSGDIKAEQFDYNSESTGMLEGRAHQDGEAARMFGVPGALVEYNAPGSSLTYQSIPDVYTNFVRSCLAPNYLEPMEQALSDLLPRNTVARFNVQALYRADARTRWDIYANAVNVIGQEEAAQWAREQEGFAPGDIEYKPVPYSPPAAVPARLPEARSAVREVRCDGRVQKRQSGVVGLYRCNALLSKNGEFRGRCRRCKKDYSAVA